MTLLHRPRSIAEALALIAGGEARLIAGGTDVFPALVDRPLPAAFVDLTRVPELRALSVTRNAMRIGAAVRWSEIARANLPPALHMLQQAAREIGAIQIQNRGTLGGNLCNASPAADGVPPLLALDAQVELVSANGKRTMPLETFLIGNRRTARAADEIMTAILVTPPQGAAGSAFVKLGARKYLVISIVMAAAMLEWNDAREITRARLAVGAASAVAQRLRTLEQRLIGGRIDSDFAALIDDADFAALAPIDDVRATAEYRLDAARDIVAQAISRAAEAQHG